MKYRVRSRSGREWLTEAPEPSEAMLSTNDWRAVTFHDEVTGRTVLLRGDALESVEIEPEPPAGQDTTA